MYMQTPQNEHNIEDQNEYLHSLERWSFIFDSLLLSEGSDLTALLREFALELCHGHICIVPGHPCI